MMRGFRVGLCWLLDFGFPDGFHFFGSCKSRFACSAVLGGYYFSELFISDVLFAGE